MSSTIARAVLVFPGKEVLITQLDTADQVPIESQVTSARDQQD